MRYNKFCLSRRKFASSMPKRGALISLAFACFALGVATSTTHCALAAEQRVALVIGNSAYPTARLRNPVNDANAMAAKLSTLGFDVILRTDATQREMSRAISEFGKKLKLGSVGLFYFAGHGMQVRGKNFLIPVDAEIETEGSVRGEAVDVEHVLDQLGAAQLSMIILDACRNNPFETRFRRVGGGLAQIDAPTGSLLAYATAPGKVASDGPGNNGLYTAALLKALDIPGLKVEDVFKQVRNEVIRESDNQQIPWESSSLTAEFYFRAGTKAQIENARLQQSERERAELLREMEKLRVELLKMREGSVAVTVAAAGPAVADSPAQIALAAPAPAPGASSAGAPPTDWKSRISLLEKSRGQLSLSRALAVLLDLGSDEHLSLLLTHEAYVKNQVWHNAYALGIDSTGNLIWGGGANFKSANFATGAANEYCAKTKGDTCRIIIQNGEFKEQDFLELAKRLREQNIASLRQAFLQSLAKKPAQSLTSGSQGHLGGNNALVYSSPRN